jgi:hypothetical protein
MMLAVNTSKTGLTAQRRTSRSLLPLALIACAWMAAASAGQTSDAFQVSVTLLPTGPGTCTTAVEDGRTLVNCRPVVVGTATTGASRTGTTESVLGYRIPDSRVRLAGAVVEVGEESSYAWGEYSSRMILADGVEYVEMTVTW